MQPILRIINAIYEVIEGITSVTSRLMKFLYKNIFPIVANVHIGKYMNIHPIGKTTSIGIFDVLHNCKVRDMQITDGNYRLISRVDMIKFLKTSIADMRKYVKEIYDCDDFAATLFGQARYMLAGFAVGIVHVDTPTGKHALNFFITRSRSSYTIGDLQFYYIEPQTSKVFTYNEGLRKGYKPYFAYI